MQTVEWSTISDPDSWSTPEWEAVEMPCILFMEPSTKVTAPRFASYELTEVDFSKQTFVP